MTKAPPRIVFDESSVDFRLFDLHSQAGDPAEILSDHLDTLADAILEFRHRGLPVMRSPFIDDAECWPGVQFTIFLASGQPLPPDSGIGKVDRDARLRCASLLTNHCQQWEEDPSTYYVTIDGRTILAPSLAWAHTRQRAGTRNACLVLAGCTRRGEVEVTVEAVPASLHFIAEATGLPAFLRTLFSAEGVAEAAFFALAEQAFPYLRFAHTLNFGKFEGSYEQVREAVVDILGRINDDFLDAMREHKGRVREVAQALGSVKGFSLESRGTRASERLMAMRDVSYRGQVVRCEWHGKLEPNRNRIHFAPLGDGTILIGIFTEHLPT